MVFFFMLCPAALAQMTHYYESRHQDTGALSERSLISIRSDADGKRYVHFEKGYPDYTQTEDYVFGPQYETLSGRILNKNERTDYTIMRQGTSAVITGTLEGKEINRQLGLGNDPLFLFPKFNLAGFVLSDKKMITFWSLRNDTLEEYKMIAKREGVENIIISGKPTTAAKVYLTTANPLFRIFKRTYYFRLNDGLFLKQEYADGRVRELVKEE